MKVKRTVSEEDLARLKREREEADRRYNEALTGLDRAIPGIAPLPHPPPLPDETQVTPLNTRWDILGARQSIPGWRGRVAEFVWRLVAPLFAEQQAFNAALVDHINRNIQPQREIPKSIETTIASLREHLEGLGALHAHLIAYLQQVTPYVDTKDYELAALARRVIEDAQNDIAQLDATTRGVAAGISGVADAMWKQWESMLARDQRYDGRLNELGTGLAVVQQQATAVKRAVERLGTAARGSAPASDATRPTPAPPSDALAGRSDPDGQEHPGGDTDSWKYVGFENLFRGSSEEIRERVRSYVPLFTGASDVLDVGCGRGEFLELLRESGITARGIDLNHEMVELCRGHGLQVEHADALGHLGAAHDVSVGGLFAAQVVEHFEPEYLLRFLDQAQRVLRPGAAIVLETINAACWLAFFESYIRDLTHARPLHPDTLRYLVSASGFVDVDVRFAAAVPPAHRLQPSPRALRHAGGDAGDALSALAETFDGNVDRLNRLMFAHLDYAVVARRP